MQDLMKASALVLVLLSAAPPPLYAETGEDSPGSIDNYGGPTSHADSMSRGDSTYGGTTYGGPSGPDGSTTYAYMGGGAFSGGYQPGCDDCNRVGEVHIDTYTHRISGIDYGDVPDAPRPEAKPERDDDAERQEERHSQHERVKEPPERRPDVAVSAEAQDRDPLMSRDRVRLDSGIVSAEAEDRYWRGREREALGYLSTKVQDRPVDNVVNEAARVVANSATSAGIAAGGSLAAGFRTGPMSVYGAVASALYDLAFGTRQGTLARAVDDVMSMTPKDLGRARRALNEMSPQERMDFVSAVERAQQAEARLNGRDHPSPERRDLANRISVNHDGGGSFHDRNRDNRNTGERAYATDDTRGRHARDRDRSRGKGERGERSRDRDRDRDDRGRGDRGGKGKGEGKSGGRGRG